MTKQTYSLKGEVDTAEKGGAATWKLLIVDDELSVHEATRLALWDFQFAGRELLILQAYSAAEARVLLCENPDIAVVLLDVVMETPDAGLTLVDYLRHDLGNQAARIILRTGQPGQAPERDVVTKYDINDYKQKTELTATRLFTTVYSALRAYQDIRALETNRRGLEAIIDASHSMFGQHSLRDFAQGVLEQLTALFFLEPDAVYCHADGLATAADGGGMEIIAATGKFKALIGSDASHINELSVLEAIQAARESKTHVLWKDQLYVAHFLTANGRENIVCLRGNSGTRLRANRLVELFMRNVSVAFDNIHLHRDLTAEVEVRRTAERRAEILARLPGELPDPVIRLSNAGEVIYANDAGHEILDYFDCVVGEQLPAPWPERIREIAEANYRQSEEFSIHGKVYEMSFAPVPEAGYLNAFGRDVTNHRQMIGQLEHVAFHDPLTDLPNRLLFNRHLQQAVNEAERYGGLTAAMVIDLNHFKRLNDTWGHAGGDAALCEMADRLRQLVRSADLAARLGGDEFGIVLTRVNSVAALQQMAERILDSLRATFRWKDRSWSMECSIGLATYPADAQSADQLMRCADMAMYHAKKDDSTGFRFYDGTLHQRIRQEFATALQLRHALSYDRFELHYQPVMDLLTGSVIGGEALLRLRDGEGRLILPDEFINVAEDTNLIEPIGEWVLQQVCHDVNRWLTAGLDPVRIAFNVSTKQFHQPGFAQKIRHILQRHTVEACALDLEITESVLLTGEQPAVTLLNDLKELGLSLTIDDFGTGYSSLSYLRQLPVSKIKIDRSFVVDMPENEDAVALVNAIISLGRNLRLDVVAEGIENEAQVKHLLAQGCHKGQGFHFHKPLPREQFAALLAERGST